MNVRRMLVAIPAALVLAATAAAPAMADNMIEVGQQATLIAKGVAVDVPVTYTCPTPGAEYGYKYLNVRMTQVVRAQQVATASIEFDPVCDGTSQNLTVRLTVAGGTAPFKVGTALLDATLYTYDDSMVGGPVVARVSQEERVVH